MTWKKNTGFDASRTEIAKIRMARLNDPAGNDSEMQREYGTMIGDDGTELTPEQVDALNRLCDVMNVYAVRRMMDHNLYIGRYGAALKNCYDAACLGDTGTALRILTDPRLTEHDDMEFLSACNTARFVIDSALMRCEGFRERAEKLSSESILAAETLAQALRHTSEIGLYRTGLEDGIRMGSPICMHLKASDMLYPGFSGKHVDRLDEALDLMEKASLGHWRPALVMGQMRLAGRYFDRNPEKALEDIARSCRMTDAEPPRNWLRYLAEVPGDTDNDDEPEPGRAYTVDLSGIPEWHVLTDVTASWGRITHYTGFANACGCFENDAFMLGPPPVTCLHSHLGRTPLPVFLFKPTGFRIIDRIDGSCNVMTEGLSEGEFRMLLRICIGSAMDDIRGMGA